MRGVVGLSRAQGEPGADDDRTCEGEETGGQHPGIILDPGARGHVSASDARVAVVVPNWNGRHWLPGLLQSLGRQHEPAREVILVDNGSSDDSVPYARSADPGLHVLELGRNTGFAAAANAGIRAAASEFVALVNTDVVLADDWIDRMSSALREHPEAAAVACKMLDLDDPTRVYDAGDVLRRDGVCEQRGRFGPDDGRWDTPGEVSGACAGAAIYRR